MQLLNLNVDRVIIHQIFKRDQGSNVVNPAQSREYKSQEVGPDQCIA